MTAHGDEQSRTPAHPEIGFRALQVEDLPQLVHWQRQPHVARWWRDPSDLASITAERMPSIEGTDPTEVFVITVDGRPAGIIQRYLVDDYPEWSAAIGLTDAAGIDYYVGERAMIGRGIGSRAIARFAAETLDRYPEATMVVADPQQDNVGSWRALEKAGFERLWAGGLTSPDPSDAGPAYLYGLRRRPRHRHPNQRDLASLPVELRRTRVPAEVRAWVQRVTGAAVARVRRLPGASSTAVHGLVLSDGRRVVLRRYAWPGFLDDEPLAPRREVDALEFAGRHGLAAPQLLASDLAGDETADGVPVLLMAHLPGRPVAVPDLRLLAETAAAIHDTAASGFGHQYFPWYQDTTTGPPHGSTQPALWARAIEIWRSATPSFHPTFIHRDFHPGNVLWSRRRLSGVVDWANACRGPRGCDVAACRANLIELGGAGAADRFVAAYEAVTGTRHDPYWDLASILESVPSSWTPPRLAHAERRLARVLQQLH